MPISISENQFLAIANAAAALCPSDRDQFVAAVHAELAGKPIGDGMVARASAVTFPKFWHAPDIDPRRHMGRHVRTSKLISAPPIAQHPR